jgi:hypothetical protein
MQYVKASVLARTKEIRDDGAIVEVVIRELPEPLSPSTHSFKYRLFYGTPTRSVCGTTTSEAKATIGTSSATSETGVLHEGNHRSSQSRFRGTLCPSASGSVPPRQNA